MASVLVVAEEGVGRRIAWVLNEEGHDARTVESAAAALQDVAHTPTDAIVVNDVVPREELLGFVQQLRCAAPGAALLDIAHHRGDPPAPIAADASLTQPFHADDLVRELQHALDRNGGESSTGPLQRPPARDC